MTIKPLYMILAAGALGAALVPVVRRMRHRREAQASNGANRNEAATAYNRDRNQAASAQRPVHAGAAGD